MDPTCAHAIDRRHKLDLGAGVQPKVSALGTAGDNDGLDAAIRSSRANGDNDQPGRDNCNDGQQELPHGFPLQCALTDALMAMHPT
jgi:hypothetical protein